MTSPTGSSNGPPPVPEEARVRRSFPASEVEALCAQHAAKLSRLQRQLAELLAQYEKAREDRIQIADRLKSVADGNPIAAEEALELRRRIIDELHAETAASLFLRMLNGLADITDAELQELLITRVLPPPLSPGSADLALIFWQIASGRD